MSVWNPLLMELPQLMAGMSSSPATNCDRLTGSAPSADPSHEEGSAQEAALDGRRLGEPIVLPVLEELVPEDRAQLPLAGAGLGEPRADPQAVVGGDVRLLD